MRRPLHDPKTWIDVQSALKPFGSFRDPVNDTRFICPKCRAVNHKSEIKVEYIGEWGGLLVYTCPCCGYEWRTKTADAD
jgi:hypothetical protein